MQANTSKLNYEKSSLGLKMDALKQKGPVEDHFFVNKAEYRLEEWSCFEPVRVEQGQTFEFSANVSTIATLDDKETSHMFL